MATFEDDLKRLEGVVERLEQGELTLDESVRLFEEGMKLSASCKAELEAAEGKIQVLVQHGRNAMQAEDFAPEATRTRESR